MIILPIKKKWFDMIKSGEKKEEYREIKRYWITRFNNKGILSKYNPHTIIFRNGYGKNRPSLQCKVNVRVGQGKEKWGAKKRKRVLRFRNFGGARTMTKEQEKVIERLNSFIKVNKDFFENQGNMLINKKDIQDIGTVLSMLKEQQEENKKKDNTVRKIISRLDNDYKRITETLQDGKHCDDYSRDRLKAYRTKTREIKEYIEEQYFERKAEQ